MSFTISQQEQIEQVIVHISTDLAKAVTLTQQAKALAADLETSLIQSSLELEKLYMSIGDREI